MKFLFIILILSSSINLAFSQLPTLSNLPPDIPNYTLEQDPEHLKRPRLTLKGFRSTSNYGARSVRRVIEDVFINEIGSAKKNHVARIETPFTFTLTSQTP